MSGMILAMGTDERLRAAGRVLGAAFEHDPGSRWFLPAHRRRRRPLSWMYTGLLRHCDRVGGVVTVADGRGVAAWAPSDRVPVSIPEALRAGLATLPLRWGLRSTARLLRHEAEADALLRRVVAEPFGYVYVLGADPAAHGRGLGRLALEGAQARMAAAGVATVALRTENPDNVSLYRHLGFELLSQEVMTSSGLTVWTFARQVERPR